jgi:eukaryotic-like serine/threonine-protein kinase
MTDADRHLMTIFTGALDRDSGPQRAAYLDEACGGDAALRDRVEALLRAHEQLGGFLEPRVTTGSETASLAATPANPMTGAVIAGRYKLIEEIGEGGMGTVWMAQQTEPVKRGVAVKLIKPGMDSKQVLARFEAERQALALMDHPNIAKVLGGGMTGEPGAFATGGGRPFFVMELVKGVPITKYCDEHRLTPRQRLELFVPVCQAVQHAHQKGVIHRDIKPSNILVAQYDGRPVPKVIDFGVAKAAGQQLTDKTLMTGFGAVVGTLEYMSPEQAELNQLDIDTRSDIYSLGVVLYELLTGSTPLDRKRLKQAAFAEVLRIIREEEPPKPSTRLSGSKDSLPSVSAQRHMEPAKLTKLVRGELDWIVMKALEKDRNRRYETANGFAMDVQRYLADEPVLACPPSAWYRFRKMARRNKAALLSAMVISLALVMAVVALAVSNVLVRRESDQKEQALREKAAALKTAEANFRKARAAVDKSFTLVSESDLFEIGGLEPLRKQLLESALQYYKEFVEQAPDDPKLEAELSAAYFRIWQIYRSTDRYRDAMAALRKALDIAEKLRRDHPGNTDVLSTLATVRYRQLRFGGTLHAQFNAGSPSDVADAIRTLERAAALWASLAAENPRIGDFHRNLGEVYDEIANLQIGAQHERSPALETARKAYAVWEKLGREHPAMVAGGREKEYAGALLATCLHYAGHREEVQKLWRAGIDFAQKRADQQPKDRQHRSSLASLYRLLGESRSTSTTAEQPLLRAISLFEDLIAEYLGITSYLWHLGDCCRRLGQLLQDTWRPQGAELYYCKALKAFEKLASLYPESAFYLANACGERVHLAGVCVDTKRYEEAGEHYRRALELADAFLARSPRDVLEEPSAEASAVFSAYGHFASFLATCPDSKQRNLTRALELSKRLTQLAQKGSMAWITRGRVQVALGRWDSAVGDYSKAIEVAPPGERTVPWAYSERASAYRMLKQPDKALADLNKATELWPNMFEVWAWRGWFHLEQQQWDKALADFTRAVELNPTFWPVWFSRAVVHVHLKKFDQAVADCTRGLELKADLAELWQTRGDAYAALDQWDKAVADYAKAIELDPRASSGLTEQLKAKGRLQDVEKLLRQAITENEKLAAANPMDAEPRDRLARTHHTLAEMLAQKKQPQEAIKEFREAIAGWEKLAADFPDKTEYRQHLSYTYGQLGESLAAQEQLQQAAKLYQEAISLRAKLVEEFPTNGDHQQLLAAYYDALVRVLNKSRQLQDAQDVHRRAMEFYDKLATAHPHEPGFRDRQARSRHNLAELLQQSADKKEAANAFREAITIWEQLAVDFPGKPEFRQHVAWSYGHLGGALNDLKQPEEAEKALTEAVSVFEKLGVEFPTRAEYRSWQGGHLWQLGATRSALQRTPEAEKAYRQAAAVYEKLASDFPKEPFYQQELGFTYYSFLGPLLEKAKRTGEAEETYRKAVDVHEKLVTKMWNAEYAARLRANYDQLSALLKANGRAEEEKKVRRQAIAFYEKLAMANPKMPEYQQELGQLYSQFGEWEKAAAAYGKAIELKPDHWQSWLQRGRMYANLRQWNKAIADYKKSIELDSKQWESWSNRGYAHFALHQWDKSILDYTKAIELAPDAHTNWLHRGIAYMELGQWDKVVVDFSNLLKRFPDDYNVWHARAVAYVKLNQPELAVADLRQAFAKGYKDLEGVKKDDRFAPLRMRDDFKKLLAELERKKP